MTGLYDGERPPIQGDGPIVLVGHSPNLATEGRPDLWLLADESGAPHTANRLRDLCGLSTENYNRVFARTNLLTYCPTRPSRGRTSTDRWSRRDAELEAARLLGSRLLAARRRRPVLLLGRSTQRAFGSFDWPWTEWRHVFVSPPRLHAVRMAAIPHPSGRNRLLNPGPLRDRVQAWLRELVAPLV